MILSRSPFLHLLPSCCTRHPAVRQTAVWRRCYSGSSYPPVVGRIWHSEWKTLENYFAEYQRMTAQLHRVQISIPAPIYNERIKAKTSRFPDELSCQRVEDPCTRNTGSHTRGTFRSRWEGKRDGHVRRSTGCKASLAATLLFNKDNNSCQNQITHCVTRHNHDVNRRIHEIYASQRKIEDEGVLDVVNELAESNSRLIVQNLRESTGT